MKKIFSTALLVLIFFNLSAQKAVQDFKVNDIYGHEHKLYEDYLNQGKWVFLNFFTQSCTPCRELAPKVDTVFRNFGCNYGDVVFLGIDADAYGSSVTDSATRVFTQRFGMTFPAVSGERGGYNIFNDYGYFYTPYKILIDPSGKIRVDNMDMVYAKELRDSLQTFNLTLQPCQGNDFIFYSLASETDSVVGNIDNVAKTVQVSMPSGTDLSNIRANFINAVQSEIKVNGIIQISGETYNDFSSGPLIYQITSEEGITEHWTVLADVSSNVEFYSKTVDVYPNPSKGQFTIHLNSDVNFDKKQKVYITDLSGRIINTFYNLKRTSLNIDISNHPSGVYFLNFESKRGKIIKKLVIY